MNAGALIARIGRRGSIPPTDSRYAGLMTDLNDALHEWESSHPNGWDYTLRTVTFTTTDDVSGYPFDDIAAELPENALLVAGDRFPILKIDTVDYMPSSGGRCPLERQPRGYLRDVHVPDTAALPRYWYAEGETLFLTPAPPASVLELRVLIGERDLTAEDQEPLVPARFQPAIIQLGRAYAYEAEQDENATDRARLRYKDLRLAALASDRPNRGPGRATNPGWDVG